MSAHFSVKFGAAVDYTPLFQNAPYQQTLLKTFTMITPENEMKFDALEPQEGVFNFQQADAMIAFAQRNGLQVRGNALAMNGQIPTWVTQGHFTSTQLSNILKTYITVVVGHFRGKVVAWDVVNEAVADDGSGLRDNFWMQGIGPDYIADAFRWAHAADPTTTLYLNDYNNETLGGKGDVVYSLARTLLSQGVPIQGIGMEMHEVVSQPPDPTSVAANMQRFAALGLVVAVTEMDVRIYEGTGTTAQRLAAQAQLYASMATVCRQSSACKSFTTWGISDADSWIPEFFKHPDAPLLFDQNYQPKPAYYAVVTAFAQS